MCSFVVKAVETGATGAFNHVFPPFIKLEDGEEDEKVEVEYRSRFSCNWRMVPPVAILAVLIIGVILPIIWESYYLAIPFGLAAITDGYLIYLTQQYPHLKDLTSAVSDLMQIRTDLGSQVQALTQQNQAHLAQLKRLKSLVSDVESVRDDLRDDVDNLEEAIQNLIDQHKDLTHQIEDLQEANETFTTQVTNLQNLLQTAQIDHAKHLQELGQLGTVLTTVVGSVKADHTSFKMSCDTLEKTTQKFDTLTKACEPLNALLQEIAIWKDEGVVHTRLVELAKIQGQLEEVSSALIKERKRLSRVVDETEKGNAVFQKNLTRMTKQLTSEKKNGKDPDCYLNLT